MMIGSFRTWIQNGSCPHTISVLANRLLEIKKIKTLFLVCVALSSTNSTMKVTF